jgi:hypothetical protein
MIIRPYGVVAYEGISSGGNLTPVSGTRSIEFDGANDQHVDVGVISFDRLDTFSINIWLKSNLGSYGNQERWFDCRDASGGYTFSIRGTTEWQFELSGSTGDIRKDFDPTAQSKDIYDGGWHMITLTYDGSSNASGVKLYFDATEITTTATNLDDLTAGGATTNNLHFGIARNGTGSDFDGKMNQVSVFNTELSSGDITSYYNSGDPVDLSGETGITNYWAFGNGDTYPTLTDSVGSNNGTMTNMNPANIVGDAPNASLSDPYFSSVSLLLHMDGINGGSSFPDNSNSAHTMTVNGATTSTGTVKFGTASASYSASSHNLQAPSNADFDFGTGDLTIEGWVQLNSLGLDRFLMDMRTSVGDTSPSIYIASDNKARWNPAGGSPIVGTTVFTTGVWYHIAISRNSNTTRLFVDGAQEGMSYADSNNYPQRAVNIGNYTTEAFNFDGYIDDFRITKGVARYTNAFTPPSGSFPNS